MYILKCCDISHVPYTCYVPRSCESPLTLTPYFYFAQNTKHVECNCIQTLVTSPLLDPNILLNTPSRRTLNLSSSPVVTGKVLCTIFNQPLTLELYSYLWSMIRNSRYHK